MDTHEILEAIDKQITQLRQARVLLAGNESSQSASERRRRFKTPVSQTDGTSLPVTPKAGKRTLSAESRARIAAAQKARWAVYRKAKTRAGKAPAKSGETK